MDDEDTSPVMSNIMSAFQAAGRRRGMTNDSMEYEHRSTRQVEVEQENKRQERIRARAPGRKNTGQARAGDVDAVLDQIRDEWEFIIDPDFNHVELALQLLDESSVGKDMDSFRQTKHMLARALKGSVDKHYQALAASLPHHAALLTHLSNTQGQITDTRAALQEAKESLGNRRADLAQLWTRGQTLEDMMRLLDQMEYLKGVPDVLETLMSEKRLLSASVLLVRSLKTINKSDMLEIGALSDLRNYLQTQETALKDILVDELHSHLYLKSFWCDSRWAVYTPNQQSLPRPEFEDIAATPLSGDAPTPTSPSFTPTTRLGRFLQELSLRPSDPPYDIDGTNVRGGSTPLSAANTLNVAVPSKQSSNPESDSFAYLETLLESLAVLGKLGSGLDTVSQRLPGEIFSLVDLTLDEVEERSEYGRRMSMLLGVANGTGLSSSAEGAFVFASPAAGSSSVGPTASAAGHLKATAIRLAALESSAKHADLETLRDFFWTLYSKLDAVCQGLRVVSEVSQRVGSRRQFKDSSGTKAGLLFPIAEIWPAVQAEIRGLLHDYLTSEEQGVVARNPISSINEILRDSKFSRDKSKYVFRFADTDVKFTTKTLKIHEDELLRVLKDTMPGLVQGSIENSAQTTTFNFGSDDRMLGNTQHHRILIKPDAFHVNVLFRPTLAFLHRVAEILPSGADLARSGGDLLEDFVTNVYLPQLEEKVSALFHTAVGSSDSFQAEPLSLKFSQHPVIKGSVQLIGLINSLCAMLETTPFHRESYARLILSIIIQYYTRCSDRYQDLVSVWSSAPQQDGFSKPKVGIAATWAQHSELAPCLMDQFASRANMEKLEHLCKQETDIELTLLGNSPLSESDLIPSTRTLSSLGSLYRSVSWFAAQLNTLKSEVEEPPSAVDGNPSHSAFDRPMPPPPRSNQADELIIPLSKDMNLRFQALLKTYEQLAELIVDTVRLDIRSRVMFYLDSAMRFGNYQLDYEAGEPDSSIIDLNDHLAMFSDVISTTVPSSENQFVFAGLGQLIEQLLIQNARYLRLVTKHGIKKIMRNMLALQQGIKVITQGQQSTQFDRAKRYYSLFHLSPRELLETIRQKQEFSFEEYRTMLSLQCNVDESKGEAGISEATDRNYSMYIIDLHSIVDVE